MSENIRVHLLISGRVQGVCYRAESEKEATSLGLKGWVRNTEDGTVEMLLEGEKEKVEKMITWCHRGPDVAKVKEVLVEWSPFRGDIPDFRITR